MSRKIGFVGLGMMGAPMCARLVQAGFDVFVMDADPNRVDQLCNGFSMAPLTPQIAEELDVLITMLPNSTIVEAVLLSDGWAERLRPNALVMDMSSSEPTRSRALADQLREKGLCYLDAPVSGGVKRAIDGTLAILVGGEKNIMDETMNVLEAMGKSILHIGPAGAGHAAKALNNFVSACGLMVTVEALQVAQRFGISPEVMTDVLNASSGRSNTSENKVKQFMLSGTFASGFSLQLMDKDLGIARSLAQSVGLPLAFGNIGINLWHEVAQHVGPSVDHTEMYRLMNEKQREPSA